MSVSKLGNYQYMSCLPPDNFLEDERMIFRSKKQIIRRKLDLHICIDIDIW